MGLYTNALWDYAHFKWHYGECLNHYRENILHDHFDLYLILFSPLGYIFKSYTLLVVQWAAIILGGIGTWKVAKLVLNDRWAAFWSMALFYSFFGIYSALAFDYHSNVVAAMVLPWFFYSILKKNMLLTWGLFIFIIIGKENMSLWMLFVCLGAAVHWYRTKRTRVHLLVMSLFSAIYFVTILQVVMPALTHGGSYTHFNYDILGGSMSEAIVNLIKRPFHYAQYLWISQRPGGGVSPIKVEFWTFFALSGGVLLVLRPAFVLMLIPLIFQKFFNQRDTIWGINDQYAIEFAPILAIGIIFISTLLVNTLWRKWLLAIVALACMTMTLRAMDNSIKGPKSPKGRFYDKHHFSPKHDVDRIKEVLSWIPDDGAVVGSSRLIAQLAYRDRAYRLPQTEEANYFVHCWDFSGYPLNPTPMRELIVELQDSGEWETIVDDGYMVLLRRYEFK